MRPNKPERLVGTDFAATALLSTSRPRTTKGRDRLELRTSSYKSLTSLVAFVLLEVLDEAACEILSLSSSHSEASLHKCREDRGCPCSRPRAL
jgi:hypothetical protein